MQKSLTGIIADRYRQHRKQKVSGKKKRFQPGKLSVTKQSPIKRTVKQTLERRGGSYGYKSGTDLDHCGKQ